MAPRSAFLRTRLLSPQKQPNYRMKLTRLGRRFVRGIDSLPSLHSLARARLGLQLMRGR
jgi:hypothetical protein